jgi:hypothetical protein
MMDRNNSGYCRNVDKNKWGLEKEEMYVRRKRRRRMEEGINV